MSSRSRVRVPLLALVLLAAACAQPVEGRPEDAGAALSASPHGAAAVTAPSPADLTAPTSAPTSAPSAAPTAVPPAPPSPSVAATPPADPPPAAGRKLKPHEFNLYRRGDFVAQYTFDWCVGASLQMMVNLTGTDDTSSRTHQEKLWERARDLSSSPFGGANPRGWTAVLNELGIGPYELVSVPEYGEALRVAAKALRETKRPVGLVMWRGRHAWVMSGFTSVGDPRRDEAFRVTGVRVLDPLYPHGSSVWGASPRPNRLLTPKKLAEQFVSRDQSRVNLGVAPGYVLVLPVS